MARFRLDTPHVPSSSCKVRSRQLATSLSYVAAETMQKMMKMGEGTQIDTERREQHFEMLL